MIDEKTVKIELNGVSKNYILSKVPCIPAREIFSQYLTSATPKLGDYAVNQALMLKMMRYVQVDLGENDKLALENETLVNQHVPDWETLVMLEKEMIVYNCGFFQNGKSSDILEKLMSNALSKITEMLTDSLDVSFLAKKPNTEN